MSQEKRIAGPWVALASDDDGVYLYARHSRESGFFGHAASVLYSEPGWIARVSAAGDGSPAECLRGHYDCSDDAMTAADARLREDGVVLEGRT